MKKLILSMCILLGITSTEAIASDIVDVYNFRMMLRVPRVYDNMSSLGYRKYQTQVITGTLMLKFKEGETRPEFVISNLVNKTHKLSSGKNVTYETYDADIIYPRFNVIGSNKKNTFKTPSVVFSINAEPSYNIGETITDDNSLYLLLSGTGTTKTSHNVTVFRTLHGYATGTLGCGCADYGHVSPTRVMGVCGPTDVVDDVAAVYGTWRATYKTTKCE